MISQSMSDEGRDRGGLATGPILILRLGAVGDVIRTLPLLHALRAAHPGRRIAWVVEELSAGLLSEMPALDAVHVLRRREIATLLRDPRAWPRAIRILRDLRADLRTDPPASVLDVHGTLKAAIVARLAGSPVTGFGPGGSKEGAHLLYSECIPFPAIPMSRVRRALYLGAASGLLPPDAPLGDDNDPRVDFGLRFPPARVEKAKAFLAQGPGAGRHPCVLLFPFASASGQAKRWPMHRHVELGRRLHAAGARVILGWGGKREGEEARAALAAAPEIELAPPTDLVELAELLRRCDLVVTGDTGPMHLAAGVGTRVLALFGPTDPEINRPFGVGHETLVHRPLADLSVARVESIALAMMA